MCVCVYIYIYRERERESVCVCVRENFGVLVLASSQRCPQPSSPGSQPGDLGFVVVQPNKPQGLGFPSSGSGFNVRFRAV